MYSQRTPHSSPHRGRVQVRCRLLGLGCAVMMTLLGGCVVPPHQHRLVSKPNMLFGDSEVYSYNSRIMTQIQPGLAASGGAQASTCTICQ